MVLPLNHYDIDEKTGDYDTRTQREDETNIQCSHCGLDLRPESALMHEGEPFCDEFCRDTESKERREKIPFGAGLHQDGTIHIYVKEKDSGLSVGLGDDGTLWVRVDESKKDVANNYIKGFNLTAVKRYMGVLDLPAGAAEIEYKTTVNPDAI